MAFKTHSASTTTGASEALTFRKIVKDHTVQMTTTGAPTAVTVDLEGSLDGTTFEQLATHDFTGAEITAQSAMFHVVDKPVRYIRTNITTLTGGTSPTVTVLYEPFEKRD